MAATMAQTNEVHHQLEDQLKKLHVEKKYHKPIIICESVLFDETEDDCSTNETFAVITRQSSNILLSVPKLCEVDKNKEKQRPPFRNDMLTQ